jgi:hypothetical protein
MRRSRFRILSCLLALLALYAPHQLGAQAAATDKPPSPSRLRAAIEGATIELSWNDAPSGAAGYAIYRSLAPFSKEAPPLSQLVGTAAPGKGAFVDKPPAGQEWYYLVLAVNEKGQPWPVFERMNTMTIVGLSVAAAESPQAKTPAPAASAAPSATTAKQAAPVAAKPQVSTAAAPSAGLSTAPLALSPPTPKPQTAQTQAPQTQAAPPKAAPTVQPKIIAAAGSRNAPSRLAEAETEAVEKKPAETEAENPPPEPAPVSGPVREAPLPAYLYASGDFGNGGQATTPGETKLGSEAAKAISSLTRRVKADSGPRLPEMRILQGGSREARPAGDASQTIAGIAKDMGASSDWGRGRDRLAALLSSGLGPEEAALAHYYLGIALVRLGTLREGLFEFLQAQGNYPLETKPWIDYVIDTLGKS